jgi:5,5'-dehydrodivanillate O-demethylase
MDTTVQPRKVLSDYEDFVSTGPDTLNGRFLRRFWYPVFSSQRLAAGEAKPIRVLSEDWTLYRGQDGTPHVVAQRCPHRGTQLSVGFIEDDCIRCLYHGWKFDSDGQCVEQPAEASEFAAKVRIRACPTREMQGLIYAYFGPGEPPPFPHIPAFTGNGVIENNDNFVHCNYFQAWENDWDEYHVAWTHRIGGVHVPPVLPEETFEETEYGVIKHGRNVDGTTRVVHFILPTTIRVTIPSPTYFRYRKVGPPLRDVYLMHTPIDDERQMVFQTAHVDVAPHERESYLEHARQYHALLDQRPAHDMAVEILAGRKTLFEVKEKDDFPAFARLEDQCTQPGQGAIADRQSEWLGRSDKGIIFLRKIWSRELQALAETGTPKVWSTMPAPEA